jgi:hypothetical protein
MIVMAGTAVRRTASLRSPMSRPSTSYYVLKIVDARHKAGHDGSLGGFELRAQGEPFFFRFLDRGDDVGASL